MYMRVINCFVGKGGRDALPRIPEYQMRGDDRKGGADEHQEHKYHDGAVTPQKFFHTSRGHNYEGNYITCSYWVAERNVTNQLSEKPIIVHTAMANSWATRYQMWKKLNPFASSTSLLV